MRKFKVDNNYKQGKYWFDEDCQNERIKFLKRKQLFDLDDTDDNRKEMCKKEVFIEKFVAKSENHTTCHKQKIFYISVKKNLSCFGKSTKVLTNKIIK